MKRGTPRHPKMQELASCLKINEAWAVGLIELLFHATSRYAPCGNIGKWPDKTIAAHLGWPRTKRAEDLISALVLTGWLDRDPEYRLIVHDWDEHADQSVRKVLKASRMDFVKPARQHWVYFIKSETTNYVKIGVTSRADDSRFRELQINSMEKLVLLGKVVGGYTLEDSIHFRYSTLRIRGEWFKLTPELLLTIQGLIEQNSGIVPPLDLERDGITEPFLSSPEPLPTVEKEEATHTHLNSTLGARAQPNPTMNGNETTVPALKRLDEFLARYPDKSDPEATARAYARCVTPATEDACHACLARYNASDRVARNVVQRGRNWLDQQSRNGFHGEWAGPPPVQRKTVGFEESVTRVLAERIQKRGKPW